MQARDSRFVNACVEFDQQTLRPTFRLVWGAAGASHALAIAEGLKFDPAIVADARRIAPSLQDAVLLAGKGSPRAKAMQVPHPGVLLVL